MYLDENQQFSDNNFNQDYYQMSQPTPVIESQPTDPLKQRQYEAEQLLYDTLSAEIERAAEMITKQVNMISDYRYTLKSAIEDIALETFGVSHSNVQAHIYGSVATDLALPESDMDIVVTGVSSFGNKEDHLGNISLLFDNIRNKFSDNILVKSMKILNTQIPIMKLSFDLSQYYDEMSKTNPGILPYVNFESLEVTNPSLKVLQVDVSI